jgi:DNA topoisomerase I
MPLILIESPNKISKLRSILGPKFTVMASVGHIMDLSKKNMGIDLDTFEATYKVNIDKKDIAKNIKAEAKKHEVIYIATDPDREGEAIAFHIASLLPKRGVTLHRVMFNAITKEAVKKAMKSPGKLNKDLYDAQQARRITDRLVGFRVSPVMWNKGMRGTSAGRVQSVALKIISDREKEIKVFVPKEYWTIAAKTSMKFAAEFFGIDGKTFVPSSKAESDNITNEMNANKLDLVVTEYLGKERLRKPYPPFITSTMQQAASNSIGWGAKKTMSVAQSLFGHGLITYHRTDSTRSDPQKVKDLRAKIEKAHGKKYLSGSTIVYGAKAGAQDAHEAIRPTYDSPVSSLSSDERKLLTLIENRFMASQMANAKFDQVSIKMEYKGKKRALNFKKNGSTLKFDGFLKVYGNTSDDVILPSLAVGDKVPWTDVISDQHFTKPPPRYSDASIIKLLEKEGVGRPSTYASILDTLLNRKYVTRDKKALCASEIGIMVSDYLTANFSKIVDTKFTSIMESGLDDVAAGTKAYKDLLKAFNTKLDEQLEAATKAGPPDTFVMDVECPKCKGKKMVKKISKLGPFLGCETWPKCDGTASIDGKPKTVAVETGHSCPKCKNILVERKSKTGKFLGCKAYPACKYSASIDADGNPVAKPAKKPAKKTGQKCPKCKTGDIVERKGRYGLFKACDNFPKCKTIIK